MKQIDPSARLREVIKPYPNIPTAASALEMSETYLRDLLSGKRPFTATVLDRIGLREEKRIVAK